MNKNLLMMLAASCTLNCAHAMDKETALAELEKYTSTPDAASLAALAAAQRAIQEKQQWPDFWCCVCKQQQSGRYEIDRKQHWASKHNKCDGCGNVFKDLKALRLHEADEHSTRAMVRPQEDSTK